MSTKDNQKSEKKAASCEMKTDLSLLLECLKFQMDNPQSQKEALVAIYSICQKNNDASDYFREIGGLLFVSILSKSNNHIIVREASLFTLGVLAESSVYCQQTLCTLELFEDISATLSNEDSTVNLKRMSVYVFLVLVSNNKTGQTLARTSGCIDVLLRLFRDALLTCNLDLPDKSTYHHYHLWSSVCGALCACANNPQNEENQNLCSSAFPQAKEWLQHCSLPEIVRPVCSLVSLTVANNSFAQESFASVGGLDTLAQVLLQVLSNILTRSKLGVVVTKTIDACIADNPKCLNCLSKYSIVTSLLMLLSCETLDPEDRFSIVLTLGHCTENSEENQYELLKSNGLPLIIQVLTESQDEELHKAATFVLQNCRHSTEGLSLKLNGQSQSGNDKISNWKNRGNQIVEYWKKAKDILHKIEHLEQQHNEDLCNIQEPGINERTFQAYRSCSLEAVNLPQAVRKAQASNVKNQIPAFTQHYDSGVQHSTAVRSCRELKMPSHPCSPCSQSKRVDVCRENLSVGNVKRRIFSDAATSHNSAAATLVSAGNIGSDSQAEPQENDIDSPCRNLAHRLDISINKTPVRHVVIQTEPRHMKNNQQRDSFQKPSCELLKETKQPISRAVCEMASTGSNSSESTFKHPLPVNKEKKNSACQGCQVTGTVMNSRNCAKILQDCVYLCDYHRVVLQAEEKYKRELRKSLHSTGNFADCKNKQLTPHQKGGMKYEMFRQSKTKANCVLLTPIKKVNSPTTVAKIPNQKEDSFAKSVCFIKSPYWYSYRADGSVAMIRFRAGC